MSSAKTGFVIGAVFTAVSLAWVLLFTSSDYFSVCLAAVTPSGVYCTIIPSASSLYSALAVLIVGFALTLCFRTGVRQFTYKRVFLLAGLFLLLDGFSLLVDFLGAGGSACFSGIYLFECTYGSRVYLYADIGLFLGGVASIVVSHFAPPDQKRDTGGGAHIFVSSSEKQSSKDS